jgi:hypothetical protein
MNYSNNDKCWNVINGRNQNGEWGCVAATYLRVKTNGKYFFWKKQENTSEIFTGEQNAQFLREQAMKAGEQTGLPFVPTAVHNGIAARLEDFFTDEELAEWRLCNNTFFRVIFEFYTWRTGLNIVPIFIATRTRYSRQPWLIKASVELYKDPFRLSKVLGLQVGSYSGAKKVNKLPIIQTIRDHHQRVSRTSQKQKFL